MYKLPLPGLHFKIKTVNTMNYFVIFHPQNQILGLIFICSSRQPLEKIINFRAILEVLWLPDNDLSQLKYSAWHFISIISPAKSKSAVLTYHLVIIYSVMVKCSRPFVSQNFVLNKHFIQDNCRKWLERLFLHCIILNCQPPIFH